MYSHSRGVDPSRTRSKMKIRASLRKICENCKLVRRGKKNLVICSTTPKHKQRQGFSTVAGQQQQSAMGTPLMGALVTALRPTSFADALQLLYPADADDL